MAMMVAMVAHLLRMSLVLVAGLNGIAPIASARLTLTCRRKNSVICRRMTLLAKPKKDDLNKDNLNKDDLNKDNHNKDDLNMQRINSVFCRRMTLGKTPRKKSAGNNKLSVGAK